MKKIMVVVFLLSVMLSGCTTMSNGNEVTCNTIEAVILYSEEGLTLPTNPTKEGHSFLGWYYDDQLTNRYDATIGISEDTDLYAAWTVKTNTILVYNGSILLGGMYINYLETMVLQDLVVEGYDFQGWYLDSALTNPVTSVVGRADDFELYVKLVEVDIVLEEEGIIDLTELPYYTYLNATNPIVTITVEGIGVMTLELFPDVAKNSVDNFIEYIQSNSYTDSTFHRVIEDFMIQGGKVTTTNCAISGEFSSNGFTNDLSHYRGVLSMARTSVVDSGTSQFFVVHQDSDFLDGNYATFGALISGFNVLDYIAGVTTDSSDAPQREIIIASITIDLNGYVPGSPVCAE
jgi:peptidyl-prolyl cis-trans isomerase B (cyclophilin B)